MTIKVIDKMINLSKDKKKYIRDILQLTKDQKVFIENEDIDGINDIIYHIVNIWDKHPFDQNSDFMYLAGDTEKNWESIKTLKQLIKNVVEVSLHHSLSKEDTLNIPTDILVQLCE